MIVIIWDRIADRRKARTSTTWTKWAIRVGIAAAAQGLLGLDPIRKNQPERRRINVSDRQDVTGSVSESESPAIPSPRPKRVRPRTNKDWWPNQLDLSLLHQRSPLSNPMEEGFNYAEEFKTLDVEAFKRDLIQVMTTSQE